MSNYIVTMKDTRAIISLITKIHNRANALILNELKSEGITDLAISHGAIFNALFSSSEKLRMNDIAEKIQKDKSTVTALINKLVKLGYVQREKCTVDTRITYITLTAEGEALKPIFYRVSKNLIDTTYDGFSTEEQVELMGMLEKMLNNF